VEALGNGVDGAVAALEPHGALLVLGGSFTAALTAAGAPVRCGGLVLSLSLFHSRSRYVTLALSMSLSLALRHSRSLFCTLALFYPQTLKPEP